MESQPQELSVQEIVEKKELEELRALAELLHLSILREERFSGVMSIVVDDGRGEEVHIGFPDGIRSTAGKLLPLGATGTVFEPKIQMSMYGHGHWKRRIDI